MNLDHEPSTGRNDLSPLYHLVGDYNVRIQEYEMSQNIIAPAAWMMAILHHKPAIVIEIGTCKGGLSNLLSSCTATYGGRYVAIDVRDKLRYPIYGNAQFFSWNCFEHIDEIASLIVNGGHCFVLCDGGNKPKEFDTFSDFIKPGDIIAAHDYFPPDMEATFSPLYWGWWETHHEKLAPAIQRNRLVPFAQEWFKLSAWCVVQKVIK